MSTSYLRRVEFFAGTDEESDKQREVLRKVCERFPELAVEEFSLDSDKAQVRGMFLAPGLVIDGVILGVGKLVSAGKIRRFLEQNQARGECDDVREN